ncbi:hypothetical protein BU15DRAFT_51517 [Melanogaster broomeanus]|nr:hypothetical protein BU15DRAFT_51517 [Melanogaster broomeanus]
MATLVAPNNPTILPAVSAGVNKRYRPAPAKTFQCRGYGECRMVFSRSEHLARHIRKHTGERPFTCHCSKQFSRLDNLRQHAQTVHADKQEQNERMMRELASLHASMAAANKPGQTRGKRGQGALNGHAALSATNSSQDNGMHPLGHIKEEDMAPAIPMHQRPGTSTGYEGDSVMYDDGWNHDIDRGDPRPHNNHSFRDSSQSFRVPPASNTSSLYGQQQSQSFLPFSNTFNFSLASRDGRPGSSNSRPPTASGPDSHARMLPPLAAVVSASISPPSQSFPFPSQSTQHILPLPGTAAFNRRPTSVGRPGTAPASYYASKPAYAGGPGLVHQSELSLPVYGRSGELAAAAATAAAAYHSPYEADPPSPTAGSYDSPFSFHPPALAEPATSGGTFTHSPPGNPRKRPFSGVDGSPDEGPRREPSSGLSGLGEYEYGSESRPQSRRLSVLELCNDPSADAGVRSFLPTAAGSASRPTTSSGLVSSASALALVDRTPVSSYSLLPGAQQAATSAAPPTPTGTGPTAFGGGRVSPASVRRDAPSPPTASTNPPQLLAAHRGAFSASPISDTSRSPRSQPAFAAVARSVSIHSNPSSPSSNGSTPSSLSRRGESQHEVRSSAYSPAALGMKV